MSFDLTCNQDFRVSKSLVALTVISTWLAAPIMAQEEKPIEVATNVQPVSSSAGAKNLVELATQDSSSKPASQSFLLPADKHPWNRFPVGAWREIEITSDSASESDEAISRSVTTQVEKLNSSSGQRYSLDVQATVNVVGKQVVGPIITRDLNSSTDQPGEILETRRLDDQDLALPLGPVNCEVWELTYGEDSRMLIDRIYYSPEQSPCVLRRVTVAEPSDPNDLAQVEKETSVVAVEVPYPVGDELQQCTCLRTVHHGQKGSTVTVAMVSGSVPGGEVAVWTTEFDLQGDRTRWSSQSLVSYGLTPRIDKPLSRRELRRARRNR